MSGAARPVPVRQASGPRSSARNTLRRRWLPRLTPAVGAPSGSPVAPVRPSSYDVVGNVRHAVTQQFAENWQIARDREPEATASTSGKPKPSHTDGNATAMASGTAPPVGHRTPIRQTWSAATHADVPVEVPAQPGRVVRVMVADEQEVGHFLGCSPALDKIDVRAHSTSRFLRGSCVLIHRSSAGQGPRLDRQGLAARGTLAPRRGAPRSRDWPRHRRLRQPPVLTPPMVSTPRWPNGGRRGVAESPARPPSGKPSGANESTRRGRSPLLGRPAGEAELTTGRTAHPALPHGNRREDRVQPESTARPIAQPPWQVGRGIPGDVPPGGQVRWTRTWADQRDHWATHRVEPIRAASARRYRAWLDAGAEATQRASTRMRTSELIARGHDTTPVVTDTARKGTGQSAAAVAAVLEHEFFSDHFYARTVASLVDAGVLMRDMRVLVACGGQLTGTSWSGVGPQQRHHHQSRSPPGRE